MLEDYLSKFRSLSKRKRYISYTFAFVVIFLSLYVYIHIPSSKFPVNEVISIDDGESLQDITDNLYKMNVIKFPLIFRTTVIILGGERKVIAGDYLLDKKESPIDLAYRLVKGQFHMDVVKVTIPEGWDVFEIANHLEKSLKSFSKQDFLTLALNKEGYLFPDTYFLPDTARPKSVLNLMLGTFDEKIKSVTGLATSTKSLNDILTMASIIEAEALDKESRRIVSGILWKRIQIGMPLQVDATFSYVNGESTFQLSLDDLKIDSPYNTYKYKGLPPGPINNPGIDAIEAALYPKTSKYLFFLTGHDGKMYYARTFDEHKRNKAKYL